MYPVSKIILLFFFGFLFLPAPSGAADKVAKGETRFSDRDKRDAWNNGKKQLEQALKMGEERDFYRRELEKLGFMITAVNYDTPEYFEYEVVKGDQTYEVQIDLDKNSQKAKKVEIDSNVWKADATDQILKGKKMDRKELASAKGAKRFSDRDRRGNWDKGKTELERALKSGEEKSFYRRELEKLGYRVTAVNYDKPDYVEYEVVKGDRTYEVQVDLDKDSHKAKKVEIDTNMWKAEATERALKTAKRS